MQRTKEINPKYVFLLILLLFSSSVFSHTINYALEKAPTGNVIAFPI